MRLLLNKYLFIKIIWDDNYGSIYVYCRKKDILQSIIQLKNGYSKYYGKTYNIKDIIIESNYIVFSNFR